MMVEAKLLRKKLKNGLIVDKWDLVNIIEQQADRIAELEKQTEPYAWYYFGEIWFQNSKEEMLSWYESYKDEYPDSKILPLYTTPQTKPLSDEEIRQLYIEMMEAKSPHSQSFFGFARAIEAKVRGQ